MDHLENETYSLQVILFSGVKPAFKTSECRSNI